MRSDTSKRFLRLQYKAPDYQFAQVELDFELQAHRTVVRSRIEVVPSAQTISASKEIPLLLDGEGLEFISLKINGEIGRAHV